MGKSSFLQDFKAFAMRGNVIDMAVGVIIGGAFGKIVSSIVADVIMPPIGLLVGGVNFTDLKLQLKPAEVVDGVEKAAVTLNYGNFLQATFDFIIIAFSIFLFIKLITKLTQKKAEAPAAPQRTLQRQHGRLPPFGTACDRGIRRIPLRRRLVFLDARRIAGPRVHRLRTAQRLPPPRRGHDDAGRTDGRTLRGGVADPACHLFADADGGTGTLGARRQAALPAAQSPPAVRTERSLRTAVEPLVRNLPMRPVTQSVVPNLRGAARQHVFLM